MGALGSFRSSVKGLLKAITAPAEDPRASGPQAAERPQELLEKVRRAKDRLAGSKKQLEARIADGRQQQAVLEGRAAQDPMAVQLQQIVGEELSALERDIDALDRELKELAVIEQRLEAQAAAISAHNESLAARTSATEARVRVRQELGDLPAELAELGVALEKVEHAGGDIGARASALGRLADLGALGSGVTFSEPAAQELAGQFAADSASEQSEAVKRMLAQGFKTLLELEYEHRQLDAVLDKRKGTDPLSVTYIPDLGDETYRQGLSVLRDGLDLARAVRSPGRDKLEAEIAQLETEVRALGAEGTDVARVKARLREERIASHRQRLDMLQRHQLRIEELLHQASRCATTLNQTRVELAALKVEGARTSADAVIETLQKTVREAREVQEELKKLGL